MTPYDHAPPLHKRSGSQKRQRHDAAKIAMTQAEKQEAMRKASACGLTVRRWQRYTGDQAIHAGTGKRFDEIACKELEAQHG